MLAETSRSNLAPGLSICRILNGMWQVSGGHGAVHPQRAVQDMHHYVDEGFTTWDLADHYGPAEDLIGAFRESLEAAKGGPALDGVQAFTKWVPSPGPMAISTVRQAVGRSLDRMRCASIDLMQFHWWEYEDSRYMEALEGLATMQQEGRIHHLGLTNFDTKRVMEIVESGIPIVSNQVQYSLIDRRPSVAMTPLSRERGIGLLTYGTLCGGLLSERFLGQPEPSRQVLDTVSLRKYKQMVDAWGGWALFQELLAVLKHVAGRHEASIANVAVRYVLDQPAVAGVIVGVRLGAAEHRADNARVFSCSLDGDDLERIELVQRKSHDLFRTIGDCGDEYRR
ncbi:MAG: aldo/keto reductase [Dehalococcoidia bacterium]|nr:aldo/keto reductase [Dehalococcoidia bacterium]